MNQTQIKVALITGGGTGIGRSAAIALQNDNYNVIVCGRRKEQLEETASIGATDKPKIRAIVADVTDSSSVNSVFAEIEKNIIRPILINLKNLFEWKLIPIN